MTRSPAHPANEADRGPSPLTRVGRILAPVLAIAVYFAMRAAGGPDLGPDAHAAAAIGVLMAVLWMTEALPLPATSLIPIALFPLAGVTTIRAAAAPYADPIIFLFMGGFMLALAMERWGLHRRIALRIVLIAGTKPRRLVAGFMAATAFLSMWLSNTATTVMMLPIGVSVITLTLARLHEAGDPLALNPDGSRRSATGAGSLNFATCLMLGIAYAASIGGLATLIGTPPNAMLRGYLDQAFNEQIAFGTWMLLGVPLTTVYLILAWAVLVFLAFPIKVKDIPGGRALIRDELRNLGPITRPERIVAAVFALTATFWIIREPLSNWDWLADLIPPVARLDDSIIAIGAALLLFAIPAQKGSRAAILRWEDAVKLPWGVLLLFGGGLSLAAAVRETGLDHWIGSSIGGLDGLSHIGLILVTVTLVIFLTELTSNTATAATFLPILGGVAPAVGMDPATLAVPAALAASCAFMLPVATPPNAIVFASGHVHIGQMIRAGVILNLIGIVLVTLATIYLVPHVVNEVGPAAALEATTERAP